MRVLILSVVAVITTCFLACNSPSSANDPLAQQVSQTSPAATPKKKKGGSIRMLSFNHQAITSMLEVKGKVVDGKHWVDANGENYAILTRQEVKADETHTSVSLSALHMVKTKKGLKEITRIDEEEEACSFDNMADFLEYSLRITDLDRDSLAEVTFAYNMGCMKDLSPFALTLLLIENGKQHRIYGTSRVDFDGVSQGGTKNVDPIFDEAPRIFRSYADSQWDEHVGTW